MRMLEEEITKKTTQFSAKKGHSWHFPPHAIAVLDLKKNSSHTHVRSYITIAMCGDFQKLYFILWVPFCVFTFFLFAFLLAVSKMFHKNTIFFLYSDFGWLQSSDTKKRMRRERGGPALFLVIEKIQPFYI